MSNIKTKIRIVLSIRIMIIIRKYNIILTIIIIITIIAKMITLIIDKKKSFYENTILR